MSLDDLRNDPWAAIERAGVPIDSLTDKLIARSKTQGAPQPTAMELRLAQLEQQTAAREQAEQQAQQAQKYESARSRVAEQLTASADHYPYLSALQDPSDTAANILNTMRSEYQRTGELPTAQDVAERFEAEAKRAYDAFQAMQQKRQLAPQPAPYQSMAPRAQAPVLTNRAATHAAAPVSANLTDQERMNLAIAALRNSEE